MSGHALGVDVSTWQHADNKPIDWEAVAGAGYRFAMIKATQGDSYVNPWLARDLEDARVAGMLVGAYHYAVAGVGGAEQGAFFTYHLVGQILELGAWIDWELSDMQAWEMTGLYTPMLEAIENARRPCGLYVDQDWRAKFVAASLPIHRLWIAAPSLEAPPFPATIWQREQADVPGIVGPVDVDELYSTRGVDLPTTPPRRPGALEPAAAPVSETSAAPAENEAHETTPDAAPEATGA